MTAALRKASERQRLEGLTAELQSAGAGHFGLDHDVHVALDLARDRLDGLKRTDLPEVTTSIDAAFALAERVLPGWHICLSSCGGPIGSGEHCEWRVTAKGERNFVTLAFKNDLTTQPCQTPALALCVAILRGKAVS